MNLALFFLLTTFFSGIAWMVWTLYSVTYDHRLDDMCIALMALDLTAQDIHEHKLWLVYFGTAVYLKFILSMAYILFGINVFLM